MEIHFQKNHRGEREEENIRFWGSILGRAVWTIWENFSERRFGEGDANVNQVLDLIRPQLLFTAASSNQSVSQG